MQVGKTRNNKTKVIIRKSGFLAGFCQVLDIGATTTRYRVYPSAQAADYEALRSDWEKVGDSITISMRQVKSATPRR